MDTQPQATPNRPKAGMWVAIVLVIVLLVGGAYYVLTQEEGANESNVNTIQYIDNTNDKRVTLQRIDDEYLITHNDFAIYIPGSWYTTETDSSGNQSLLFTASNENTDGVLGITNKETGFVMHITIEDYTGTLASYLENNPVNVGSLIKQQEVTLGNSKITMREVDTTNADAMEGSYSLEYFIQKNDKIITILFLGLIEDGISTNRETIETVIQSFE